MDADVHLLKNANVRTQGVQEFAMRKHKRISPARLAQTLERSDVNGPVELWLIRHATSENNRLWRSFVNGDQSDEVLRGLRRSTELVGLSPEGIKEAKDLKEFARRLKLSFADAACFVSPMPRAIQTAGRMHWRGADWKVLNVLRECEEYSPRTLRRRFVAHDAREANEKDAQRVERYREQGDEARDRAESFLQYIMDTVEVKRVLALSHSRFMQYIVATIEGLSDQELVLRLNDRDLTKPYKITNGCIIRYTRRDPIEGMLYPMFRWKQVIDIFHPARLETRWRLIDPIPSKGAAAIADDGSRSSHTPRQKRALR